MAARIRAWIEYDATPYYDPERADAPPFSELADGCIPLTDFVLFWGGKDYRFFAAISGATREATDPPPLFPLRGLPPNVGGDAASFTAEEADPDDPNFGWLTLDEIDQALAHMGLTRENLSLHTNLVLDLMNAIDKRLGAGHARLIFYID